MTNKYYIFIPLFFVNPFAVVLFMFFLTMLHSLKDEDWLKVLLFLLALFMGLIQITRTVQTGQPSDWVMYKDYFSEAGKYGFWDYMQKGYMQDTSKEPVYRIINYLGFHLFSGNFVHFAASLTFVLYFSFYTAIYKFWKANFEDVHLLIAAIVLFTFIIENFAITNNLLRQQFAMGIMSYVIARKVVDNKMNWWLALFACFTHTSMFLYLIILFIKPLYEVIRIKSMIWILGVFLVGGIVLRYAPFFAGLFSFSEVLSYGFNRVATSANPYELTDVINNNTVIYYNLALFTLVLLKLNYLETPTGRSQIFYTNLLFFALLLCVVFGFAPLIQIRFYISRFFLMPFVIPFLFWRNSVIINRCYLTAIVIFFGARFFMSFDSMYSGKFFPPIDELITGSILYFL